MLGRRKKTMRDPGARQAALRGRPIQLPPVRREEKNGKLYVTVRFKRPGWQRILGAVETCERTFGLDAYGRRVYERCDGKRTVEEIVGSFADVTRISLPEAEMAVTRFMKTLMSKGLIAVEIDRVS
jgi:hypothetical protein